MNAKDRKQISAILDTLNEAKSAIEDMRDNEEEKYGNMPEGLQESERGMNMEEAIDSLDAACASVEEAIDYLTNLAE